MTMTTTTTTTTRPQAIFANYLGQLRLYSLVDLVLLLIAIQPSTADFIGVLLLHVAFLAYLESRHAHAYRLRIPRWLWLVIGLAGACCYQHWEVVPFAVFSYLYTLKTRRHFALFSPVARGLQHLFVVGGITGYAHAAPWIACAALALRNLAGDVRDAGKDSREARRMITIPILCGLKKDIRHIHLLAVCATSVLWWCIGEFSIVALGAALVVEGGTYYLTPR